MASEIGVSGRLGRNSARLYNTHVLMLARADGGTDYSIGNRTGCSVWRSRRVSVIVDLRACPKANLRHHPTH